MNITSMEKLLVLAFKASLKAGKAILEVYKNENIETELKNDNSPLTLADKMAHKVISEELKYTGIPVLSEEGRNIPYEERKEWEYVWIVDPLDGTKEFINRNGDFTVNIALVHNNIPVIGVVYVPVSGLLYFSIKDKGSFRSQFHKNNTFDAVMEHAVKLPCIIDSKRSYTVVASRSHMNEETAGYIKEIEKDRGQVHTVSRGSALKICMVAEGSADEYPRFGPTMEWDTAAGHAIAIESGCTFTKIDGVTQIRYNKQNLLNPYFIVKRIY